MTRPVIVLAVIAAGLVAVAPTAEASVISMANANVGAVPTTHQNQFFRDGVASACAGNMPPKVPSEIISASGRRFAVFHFDSRVEQPVCATVNISTACTGTDAIMSETYSPSYSPANITSNWIGDLGNSPPAQTSYGFNVPAEAHFVTVVDQIDPTGNCTAVSITWTSDRPWATRKPEVQGVPAVGATLDDPVDAWAGSPAVAHQWRRCDLTGAGCTDIPGATGSGYTVTSDDVGHTLRVRESATENNLTSTALSAPSTEVFIPFETHDGKLDAGDRSVIGGLGFVGTPSRCGTATGFPGNMDTDVHLFDSYAFSSLMNEPACLWVARQPGCLGLVTLYSPAFVPSDQGQNFVAHDDGTGALSQTLAPGAGAEAVIVETGSFHLCASYSLLLGSDGPFATERPALAGTATEGARLTTTNGAWSGSPAFDHAWLRCDANGDGCAPIGGATGAAYVPARADVGHRLRSRVTATQVKSRSSDSGPSAVVVRDSAAPTARLKVARTTLQKVVKSGFIPAVVTCSEDCAIALRANVARRLGKRLGGRRIGTGKGTGKAGKRVRIRVKLRRGARRRLRGRNSVAFTLRATLTDAAGNRGTATRKARIRRKRS